MNKIALIQLSIAMAIFGSIGLFSRLTGLPAIELIFVRSICATLFLLAVWLLTRTYKKRNLGQTRTVNDYTLWRQ